MSIRTLPPLLGIPSYRLSAKTKKIVQVNELLIEVIIHEVIYPLTILYGPVKEKGKVNNRIPRCPMIEEGILTKKKKKIYIQIINIISIE
jgi:hypothetical protein